MSSTDPDRNALAALDGARVWLNSEPLTADGLRGHVVLVDIWTYSCVNWLRTLPYVSAWAERYRDRGLVVVGVHAPEFGFEHELDNVRRAVRDLNLVLAPPASGTPVRFAVTLDGRPPGEAHGLDVDESAEGTVSEPRMYQLVRQPGAVAERTFEITFADPGVSAYVFTFG